VGKEAGPQYLWRWSGVALTLAGLAALFFAQLYQAAYGITTEGMSALGMGAMLFIAGNVQFVSARPASGASLLPSVSFPGPSVRKPSIIPWSADAVESRDSHVALLNLFGIPAEQMGNAIRLPACVVASTRLQRYPQLQSTIMAPCYRLPHVGQEKLQQHC